MRDSRYRCDTVPVSSDCAGPPTVSPPVGVCRKTLTWNPRQFRDFLVLARLGTYWNPWHTFSRKRKGCITMKKLLSSVVLLGCLLGGGAVCAAAGDSGSTSDKSQSVTTAAPATAEELNSLVEAHVDEATVLKAELKTLKGGDHAVQFTWLVMLQDANDGAHRIATLVEKMGGKADLADPPVERVKTTIPLLIRDRLRSQQALLKKLQGLEDRSSGPVRDTLARLRGKLQNHINLLLSLQKKYPITGV